MIRKHSVVLSGHATSLCLEDEFWTVLKEIAKTKGIALRQLLMQIDNTNTGNLSSAIRVFVLKEIQSKFNQ